MSLTTTQLTTLKIDLATNTNTILVAGTPTAINTIVNLANRNDIAADIATWYNQLTGTPFYSYYATVPLTDVKNAISFSKFTPADPVPVDTALNVAIHQARTMLCQSFQINVNNLLTAASTVDATKSNIVKAWQDCCNTNMPSGVSGANQKGGWASIQTILCRPLTNTEKLYAITGVGADGAATTTPATCTFEGRLTGSDIIAAWNS